MKQSPIEPSKKKLKQARLPFQILSPGAVKNPLETPTQERKRKASDDNSDDDVVICENPEVKENKLKQIEKKTKVDHDVLEKETVDLTSVENDKQEGKEPMEVEEENHTEKVQKVEAKAAIVKKKSETATPKNPRKKTNVTSKKKNQGSTPRVKFDFNKTGKTDAKTEISKTENITFVDLSDSPVKDNRRNDDSIVKKCAPAIKNVSLAKEKTEEVHNGKKELVVEKGLTSSKNEDSVKINDEHKVADEKTIEKKKSTSSETESEPTKCLENLGSKLEQNAKCKETSIGSSDVCEGKVDTSQKKELVSPSNNSALDVTSVSIDCVKEKSEGSDDRTIRKGQTEGCKTENVDKPEEKESGGSTSSMSEEGSPERNFPSSTDDSVFKTPSMANSSLDVSTESESNRTASTPGTPTSSRKWGSKTPLRMSGKQLLKQKEREKLRMERERLKQEKEKKKEEEKQEKIKLKQAKEEEKLKLKQEKEDEKKREREEKEKKKQAEIDQKNEEKRLREEDKRIKEEEKKSKAEEKRIKEEEERKKKDEKKLREEQKAAEKRKSAQAFASFFVKSETKGSPTEDDKESAPVESNFQSFEVKADMRLAPLARVQLTDERKHQLDQAIEVIESADSLYLQHLRSGSYTRGGSEKTWPAPDETDDDVMIIESEKPSDEMETGCVEVEKKTEKKKHRAKLLQFQENRRPPYWGTWRKKSKFVRPRAPLNLDKTMFEYDIDSDDEWEEPEDGESLRGSDDEESQDEQYEEDDDMFVPHGYLSEEEGQDELDDSSPEAMKAKLKYLQLEFEAEMSKKQEKLKPRVIGCVWFCNSESDPKTVGSHIAEMFLSRRALWEGELPLTVVAPPSASPSAAAVSASADQSTEETRGRQRKLVPESMIPEIVKKVHGSRRKLSKLLKEILEEQEASSVKPSKRCLADKIREMAAWVHSPEIGHHCWFIKEEVRQAHNLMDLKVNNCNTPVNLPANITKFTKVLTPDERLKLLRETPSTTNTSAKETPPISPATKVSAVSPEQTTPSVKTSSIKQLFAGMSSSEGKKRIQPTLVSVPTGQSTPKRTSSIMNFMQTSAKPTCSKQDAPSPNTNEPTETEKKTKKRIAPITLTTVVAKTPLASSSHPPSQEECIVLSD